MLSYILGSVPNAFFPNSSLTSISASNSDKNRVIFHLWLSSKGIFVPNTCSTFGHGHIFHDVPTFGITFRTVWLAPVCQYWCRFALLLTLLLWQCCFHERAWVDESVSPTFRADLVKHAILVYTFPVRHWPMRTATRVEPALSGVPCSKAKVWESCRWRRLSQIATHQDPRKVCICRMLGMGQNPCYHLVNIQTMTQNDPNPLRCLWFPNLPIFFTRREKPNSFAHAVQGTGILQSTCEKFSSRVFCQSCSSCREGYVRKYINACIAGFSAK